MLIRKIFLLLGLFFLTTASARADWLLDGEKSGLSYGSIKKNAIGENNNFRDLEGEITDKGDITLVIDLSSVETWVDIRNDRIKEFLFQTADFPVATLRGQVSMEKFKDLKVGGQMFFDTSFDLDLHGQMQTLDTELIILRLSEKTIVVIPSEFIFLDAEKFNLLTGLKTLQNLAKLPSISSAVPITFHLTFHQTP